MKKSTDGEAAFEPFADGAAVRTIGALAFENGPETIALHGSLDLTRDAAGLAQARALKATVDAIVASLEAADLPGKVAESATKPTIVKNPFA
ncbi:hypothetical protein MKK64_17755 [Methylobacterium sp. E-025]|uniref:hypothetical protein n=1 Tax=Methylobacterium sp. E-025 TaxID=2836561 RepID=UPI001FB9D432|nr:hypothetical protein [Methylobacterium sp. E-025]MCJ2113028.1 hypothetical protein [Methylobacterium sp. E-025]